VDVEHGHPAALGHGHLASSTLAVFGVYMIGGFTSRNDTLPQKNENYIAMNLDIIYIYISYIILV
jgi:hypothetical protein